MMVQNRRGVSLFQYRIVVLSVTKKERKKSTQFWFEFYFGDGPY
jgi:hypothetical protein